VIEGQASGKTVAVLQPSYAPWIGVFDQLMRSDVFVYYDDVAFDKHGWRNRNRIKSPNGPVWLTVPVAHKGLSGQLIRDVKIASGKAWARKHLATLAQNYRKAEYYDWMMPGISQILSQDWAHLIDLNLAIMDWSLGLMEVESSCLLASDLGVVGGQSERLLNICLKLDAQEYLTGNAASNYLDQDMFAKQGVAITWQNYDHPVYEQGEGDFMPFLSVLDILCHCGPNSKNIITNKSSCETARNKG
jgi:WbqC-like protein family